MNQNTKQKRSAASWLAELAKGRYGEYALSVLAALLGDYYHAWEPPFSHLRATEICCIITLESHHYI